MKPYKRSDRVGGHLLRGIVETLRKKVKDPRLELANITSVKMSPDLKSAKIYFVVYEGDGSTREKVMQGFRSAGGFIRKTLAQKMGLRYMPSISFYYDDSFDYGSKIEALLTEIRENDEKDHSKN